MNIHKTPYVVVVKFSIEHKNTQELASILKEYFESVVQHHEGWLHSQFHISEDKRTILNYSSWDSQLHYREYERKTHRHPLMEKILAFNPEKIELFPIDL